MNPKPPISAICSANPYPSPEQANPRQPELDPPPEYVVERKFPRLCWPPPAQRELDLDPVPRPNLRLV